MMMAAQQSLYNGQTKVENSQGNIYAQSTIFSQHKEEAGSFP
jgi:hypothetical protein